MKGKKLFAAMLVALLFSCLFLIGCNELFSVASFGAGSHPFDGGEEDLIGVDVQVITKAAGGTMKVGNTTLYVPPLSFYQTYTCTFKIYAKKPPAGLQAALKRVYNFAPEGEEFHLPTTLTVPFSDTDLGTADPFDMKCYYYNKATGKHEPQPTIVDRKNKQFIVSIHHFSQYSFGRLNRD